MSGIEERTKAFFDRHWGSEKEVPTWNYEWEWKGPVPNYLLPGLYALFNNDSLIYIGLGRSGTERGISARLESHVLRKVNVNGDYRYVPKEKWEKFHVNRLATIGFSDFAYLSPALEDYLIEKLNPPGNQVGKKNA